MLVLAAGVQQFAPKHRRAWIGSGPENGPRRSSSCSVWNTVRDTSASGPNQKSTPNWVSCRMAARAVHVSVYRAAARCGALMAIKLDMWDEQGRSRSTPNSNS